MESAVRVDFYVLSSSEEQARHLYVARLAEKAFSKGLSVQILCSNAALCQQLDNLLWEFQPESFLPHGLEAKDKAPVLIGTQTGQQSADLVINLTQHPAETANNQQRIAEIVIQKPDILLSTRNHYSHYKNHGFQVVTHKLN